MDTTKKFCRLLMDIAIGHGIRDVVGSPGSRNTPLLLASMSREELKTKIITDERTAAFVGLGLSLVSRRPVMLLCTSGTAMLNYAPAVAEAYYQGVPLIVVSADRPMQWIDQDDSQTLHQFEALQNFVKRSYDIPCESSNSEIDWYAERCFNDALLTAAGGQPGPVHINIQLDNPLGDTVGRSPGKPRIIESFADDGALSVKNINQLCDEASGKKILLIAGFMQPSDRLNRAVSRLSQLRDVYVMAETISNLHAGADLNAVDSVLSVMTDRDKEELKPDIVITVGGALVSRLVKDYLRRYKPYAHWVVGRLNTTPDVFMSLTRTINCDVAVFLNQLSKGLERRERRESRERREERREGRVNGESNRRPNSGYGDSWRTLRNMALESQARFLQSSGWSEFKALELLFSSITPDTNLFLSNGTPIRYAQLLIRRMPHATYCNRGVSGIEGTSATAAGCAMSYKGPTILVTGDLSFSYDTGILGLNELPEDFKIVVINNNGGGIFRFIKSTRGLENREELFGQNPDIPVEGITKAYGWQYLKVDDIDKMKEKLPEFINSNKRTLMEITAPAQYSADLLIDYMNRKI